MEEQYQVFDHIEPYQQPASTGARFANYLIDMIAFYAMYFATFFVLGIIVGVMGVSEDFAVFLDTAGGKVVSYLIGFTVLVVFFTLVEGISKGRSLGKLITRTAAIREDGASITWKDALLRSLCRVIPFEPFSGLGGNPWHDTMTKTTVVQR